jgi:hypothetical protein
MLCDIIMNAPQTKVCLLMFILVLICIYVWFCMLKWGSKIWTFKIWIHLISRQIDLRFSNGQMTWNTDKIIWIFPDKKVLILNLNLKTNLNRYRLFLSAFWMVKKMVAENDICSSLDYLGQNLNGLDIKCPVISKIRFVRISDSHFKTHTVNIQKLDKFGYQMVIFRPNRNLKTQRTFNKQTYFPVIKLFLG